MYKIPLMRPSLPDKGEFMKIVDELWETRMLSNFAKYSQLMEKTAKKYFNTEREILSTVSCDIGLNLILRSFDFPKGSEVIVPSFTFNSTPNNIALNNLKPVFADVSPHSYNLKTKYVEELITDKTVAILGVHVFGNPCNVRSLEEISKRHNLKLIFDCAHAFGSKAYGLHVCEYGDAGAFSFSGTKLITSAEGGLAYFKEKKYAKKFNKLRNYGFVGDYNTELPGMNGKISEFHAGLAYLSMKEINKNLKRRKEVAKKYLDGIKNCQHPLVRNEYTTTFKDYAVLFKNRDEVEEHLFKSGIQTKKYFFPNHMTDYYKSDLKLPVTEQVYAQILCLPIFNEITEEQINYVIEKVNEVSIAV